MGVGTCFVMCIIRFSLQFMYLSSLDMPGLQLVGGMRAFVYHVDIDSTYMQHRTQSSTLLLSCSPSLSLNESSTVLAGVMLGDKIYRGTSIDITNP